MRTLKNISAISATLVAAVMVNGCGLAKQLDDMHDATMKMGNDMPQMANTTQGMAATTQGMSATTTHMDQNMNTMVNTTCSMANVTGDMDANMVNMYIDSRQGSALSLRDSILKDLNKAKTIQRKISLAGKYYMAFEFQLWKDYGKDGDAARQSLFLQGAQEFFREIHDFLPDGISSQWTVDPTASDNRSLSLFALAVAMHNLNPNQERYGMEAGFKPVSMLDLLEDALLKFAADPNKTYPDDSYVHEISLNENRTVAAYLLEVRQNFLPAMTLAQISNVAETGFSSFFNKVGMDLFHWDARISNLSTADLAEYTTWMQEALRVQDELKQTNGSLASHGVANMLPIDASFNSTVLKIYRQMVFPKNIWDESDMAGSSDEKAERKQNLSTFVKAIVDYRGC